ncbi:MAG: SDR family oxidoreductase [Rhodobacteraceae bacterium]|nr:SDR family oxidoreductase [Paracoccaceae bacterium]
MTDWLSFTDRTVVVTGAPGGIGRAIVAGFVAAGARVAALDLDQAEGGPGILPIAVDVARPEAVAQAVDRVEAALGPADVLVNAAARVPPGALDAADPVLWSQVMDINLRGALLCAQGFGRAMLARGCGALVHVASISATTAFPQTVAYSASKAGLVSLSQQLALEWGPKGVRSNCVSPGLIRTPLSEAAYADARIGAARRALVPLREIGRPEDIADAVMYLASDRARYVNGANLMVDGGLSGAVLTQLAR